MFQVPGSRFVFEVQRSRFRVPRFNVRCSWFGVQVRCSWFGVHCSRFGARTKLERPEPRTAGTPNGRNPGTLNARNPEPGTRNPEPGTLNPEP
jgi:hypothetical protein